MRFGLVSFLAGTFAVPISATASYLQSIRVPGSGFLLGWLEQHGFVNEPAAPAPVIYVMHLFPSLEKTGLSTRPMVGVTGVPELTEANVFSINDGNAILFLFATALFLAVASMAFAIYAEYRRESTLYFSAGYVCGALAIFLIRPIAGLVSLIFGLIVVLIHRNQHDRSYP